MRLGQDWRVLFKVYHNFKCLKKFLRYRENCPNDSEDQASQILNCIILSGDLVSESLTLALAGLLDRIDSPVDIHLNRTWCLAAFCFLKLEWRWWVEALDSKPDNMSFDLLAHVIEEEKQSLCIVLCPRCALCPHRYTDAFLNVIQNWNWSNVWSAVT